ncbi:MAG: hypothetical protein WC095_01965 [Candidatus Paceibacterota bacterium]
MSFRSPVRQGEYLKRRRSRYLRILYLILFTSFILAGLVVYISRLDKFRIHDVVVTGTTLIEPFDVSKKSLDFLDGYYLWVFPKNNIFIYKKKDLHTYLEENFSRIDQVSIRLGDGNSLLVNIQERLPYALWCTRIETSEEGVQPEDCYFMDKSGIIYSKAPRFSGDAYFKYYGLIDSEDPIGKKYIQDEQWFLSLGLFIKHIEKLGLNPYYMLATNEGEYDIVLLAGGKILFNTQITLDSVAFNLEALLKSSTFASTTDFSNLDYIDLRYGNKLFYKLKSSNNDDSVYNLKDE